MTNGFLRNDCKHYQAELSATSPQKLTNSHVNLNKLFTHEIWASEFVISIVWKEKSWISIVSRNYLAFLRIIKLTYLACINALKFYARLLLTKFSNRFFLLIKKTRLVKRGIEES